MQKIIHSKEYRSLSRLFDEIELFYAYTSEKTLQSQNALVKPTFDNAFKPLQSLFNEYGGCAYNFQFTDKKFEKLNLPKYNSKNMIVCFSGGKDSLSAVLHYIKCGYNVYLYHAHNYNISYPNEYIQAEKIAKELNLPIYVENFKWSGKHAWGSTHPLKSMMLYNNALQYGIKNNIGIKIAVGDFIIPSTDDMFEDFENFAGDDAELIYQYEDIIKLIIPQFHIYRTNLNYHTSFNSLLKHPNLLKLSISCMYPYRFRQVRKQQIETKFNISIPENRCGGCWKCASEYIYFTDHNIYPLDEKYYIFCLQVLLKESTSGKVNPFEITSIQELWQTWMFYPMKKSKMYEKLLNYDIHRGKLVCTLN